jgi:DNA-binding CsgD family transcriptional regulator
MSFTGVQGEVFVGRDAELALLRNRLAAARGGEPQVVSIVGAPGIGKTALLGRFLREADRVQVLQAIGDEAETSLPFGVTQQLADCSTVPLPSALAALRSGPGQGDALTVGGGIVELLGRLQHQGPVALVVDDAHWADTPSLHALAFAIRRLRADQVLAVLVVRDKGAEHLPLSLGRLLNRDGSLTLTLEGLRVTEVRALGCAIGLGELSLRIGTRLRDHTDGNPLYVRTLLQELPTGVLRDGELPLPAPRTFSALVVDRLRATPPEGERLMVAAAVLGVQCPQALAAQLAGVADPMPALDQAVAAHLLEERVTTAERTIAFPHPLIRAAVYHGIGPARRAGLHAAAAALVDDEGASLRHRAAAAGLSDGELAAELTALARRQTEAGAWAAAADSKLTAARLSPIRVERERLVVEAVECMLSAGDVADARAVASELSSFADGARRRYILGRLALVAGQHAEARGWLESAWELRDGDEGLAASIAGQLARLALFRLRGAAAARWTRKAMEAGPGRAAATNALDLLLLSLGMSGRAGEGLELAAAEVEQRQRPERLRGLYGRGMLRLWTDDLQGARADLAAAAAGYRARGSPFGVVALYGLAEAEYRMGHWDDAVVHGELAASTCDDTDQVWLAPYIHGVTTYPLAGRGEYGLAETHLAAAWAAARRSDEPGMSIHASIAEAHVAHARAAHEQVARLLQPLVRATDGRRVMDGIHEPGVLQWRELYLDALIALGRDREAAAVLADFEERAAERERRSSLAAAARARGQLEAARGRREQAEAAFRLAFERTEGLQMPFELARLEAAHGAFLRRVGKRVAAAARLRAAQERFARLDARPYLERCACELAACGLVPVKRRARDRARLTPQELAVAKLVASGLTNRQVAAQLVLSVKTIEFHLGHVYDKLGVRSRSQLVLRITQS